MLGWVQGKDGQSRKRVGTRLVSRAEQHGLRRAAPNWRISGVPTRRHWEIPLTGRTTCVRWSGCSQALLCLALISCDSGGLTEPWAGSSIEPVVLAIVKDLWCATVQWVWPGDRPRLPLALAEHSRLGRSTGQTKYLFPWRPCYTWFGLISTRDGIPGIC